MTIGSSANILVTGGAGYIGSHCCKALSRAGYRPIAYDNLSTGHAYAVKWGPLERGDILDRARLDEVISRYKPVAILHFAAFAYVGESVTDPGKYYRNNVAGSLTLLEAARDHGIKNFVFSSSCATYGIPDQLPITEETPQRPINPYGRSKLMVEDIIKDFGSAYGSRSMILRYFNSAGADPDGEIGDDHDPETHLIPLVIVAVLGKRKEITVFGTDYPTNDGTCIRDFVHVSDLADAHAHAHVVALGALLDGSEFEIFNLGTGEGHSIRQVIDSVERVTGRPVPALFGERREGDPAILIADGSKFQKTFDFKPKYQRLNSIIETALNWHSTDISVERLQRLSLGLAS